MNLPRITVCVVNSHALPTVPVYKKIELPHYYASLKLLYARKHLTEATLKGITHQLTRSRGDISSIKYVELVDKDTETEQGL